MRIPDVGPVRAFLDERHAAFADMASGFAERRLASRAEPPDDEAARREARAILTDLGAAGLLEPIRRQDWRAACLARESLGAASPLADAVYALQGLSALPMLLAEEGRARERWLDAAIQGRAMGAFAMTEAQAGSDAAAIAASARRDGSGYVLSGSKTLISNAGIADFYVVFATVDRERGAKGVTVFVVPEDTPGFTFVRPLVL
jgi:acyl-CoA dehydrogenase